MTKAFTEPEKEYIRKKLKESATDCLYRLGVRKTSIDELVRMAGISKGAFYLFYPSKELLFFDVLIDFHDEIQAHLIEKLTTFNSNLTAEDFTQLLISLFDKVNHSVLLPAIANGDIEYIERKLPDDVVRQHHANDHVMFNRLIELLPDSAAVNQAVFAGAFRAVFLTLLQQREIGKEIYPEVLQILLSGVVNQLFNNTGKL